jgi:3-dehydrosphinganine reductase
LAGHALITGGSSGIGFAAAKALVQRGVSVSLIARNPVRLESASSELQKLARSGLSIETYAADVADAGGMSKAVATAVDRSGPATWAIASAGIVHPGRFMTQDISAHHEQVSTNYLGSVHFAHAASLAMAKTGGGKLVLVSSGAALVGLYGYASYGPTKFAIRGLAESLRVELKPHGISVTLVMPGDTQTPQLEAELPLRPAVTSKLAEGAKVMSADAVAEKFIAGAERGKFLVTYGAQLHALALLQGVIGPALRLYQDMLVKRHGDKP